MGMGGADYHRGGNNCIGEKIMPTGCVLSGEAEPPRRECGKMGRKWSDAVWEGMESRSDKQMVGGRLNIKCFSPPLLLACDVTIAECNNVGIMARGGLFDCDLGFFRFITLGILSLFWLFKCNGGM